MTTEHLVISDVSIEFPTDNGPFRALDHINLKLAQGEFVSLIGHSGCGKSTVLNIVAGLYQATTGGVILDAKEVNEPGPDRAVVFQNHSLLPWLSAYQNVELAVKRVFKGRKSRAEMDEWIRHNLELVHMGHAMHKRPGEISGGMKQRVGIARALAMEPKVLLMDEPFGALDALTRAHMQDSLMDIHARLNNTVIMITHDVDEAVLLSDRIVMMTNGPAATIGEILDVDLLRPRNRLELADDARYNHYRAEVMRFLHERHSNPAKSQELESAATEGSSDTPAEGNGAGVLDINEWRNLRTHAVDSKPERTQVTLGFIPLTDCAPLVVAKEKGLFAKYGIDVTLSRESSWANIRDKVAMGMLDGAQMLAAMPIASTLGIGGMAKPMLTAMSLDLNGNGVTVSSELYRQMQATGEADIETTSGSARALKKVIEAYRIAGKKPLTFAVVFPFSSHNYLLRYWMASAGIDPDKDVKITVVPPPQMVNYLRAEVISGYCVGEPWNAMAVKEGVGHTLMTSYDIWNNHPEKVLGVSRSWAEKFPHTHEALLAALTEACAWIDAPENREEVCAILGQGRYVNAPLEVLRMSMTGTFQFAIDQAPRERPNFNVFSHYAANFPWRSHALWTLTQMYRWGQLDTPHDLQAIAARVYRPDIYRAVAGAMGLACPGGDMKSEGEHAQEWQPSADDSAPQLGADRFMDGQVFDAAAPVDYLAGQGVHNLRVELDALRDANAPAAPGSSGRPGEQATGG